MPGSSGRDRAIRAAGSAALAVATWAAALLGTLGGGHALAADPPPPVADFFAAPSMSRPVLSPSGKHLAVQVPGPDGRRRLVVLTLDALSESRLAAGFGDVDVDNVQWVNDDRLVFTVTDLNASWFNRSAPGLFAVDRSGEGLRTLVRRVGRPSSDTSWATEGIVSHQLGPNHRLLRVLRDGTADVMVLRYSYDNRNRELVNTSPLRLDTQTGRSRTLAEGSPEGAQAWLVDERGEPRALTTSLNGQDTVHWRDKPGSAWRALASFPTFVGSKGAFSPWQLGPEGDLYVLANRGDADGTSGLFRFDLAEGRPQTEPVVAIKGFDFAGALVVDRKAGRLLGVRYTADAADTAWFDPAMKALQARIDQRLAGTINRLDVPECGCSRWVLITSSADRQPPVYTLYDREADSYQRIGAAHPRLDTRRMALRDFERIPARDGLIFPVHVTRPVGKGPWPMVVLVHGGPYVRGGRWEWDADSQFLASRGYLVVEPEYRGSTGYGQKLFRAGWKQWGLKMQDDIADAARWAIAKGLADPKRVCIAGGSYGGYATLMGLIRDPDLYRCGVAWAAVTDIGLMYELTWSDLPEVWQQYGMPVLIGDRTKDAEQLAATSPLKQAARLKQPLLLAHGGVDRRVPIEHFTRFRDAVKQTNPEVETLVYGEEGHGFFKPANRFEFWTRVERFLDKNLAPP